MQLAQDMAELRTYPVRSSQLELLVHSKGYTAIRRILWEQINYIRPLEC